MGATGSRSSTAPCRSRACPCVGSAPSAACRIPTTRSAAASTSRRIPTASGGSTFPISRARTSAISSVEDRPAPVGVAPVSPQTASRLALQGTRDQHWATFRAPLPPRDYDPRAEQAAPGDQRLEGYWNGDETDPARANGSRARCHRNPSARAPASPLHRPAAAARTASLHRNARHARLWCTSRSRNEGSSSPGGARSGWKRVMPPKSTLST